MNTTTTPLPWDLHITQKMHAHGGDDLITKETVPTRVDIRPCEVVVYANDRQKVGISRENGYLCVHFWLNGNPDNSCPDKVAVLTRRGFVFKDWETGHILYKE